MIKREPVKPASSIGNWGQWPGDVEDLIRQWNATGKLSFRWVRPFYCGGCRVLCRAHTHGAAFFAKRFVCDDCLIALARSVVNAVAEGAPT